MTDQDGASALAGAGDDVRPALPEGEYAIVEVLGHRTLVGRVCEVERFGTKLLSVEPVLAGALLPPVLLSGGSLYQFTPCTAEVAARRGAQYAYQLPNSVAVTLPAAALPAPAADDSDDEEPEFAPAFLRADADEVAF